MPNRETWESSTHHRPRGGPNTPAVDFHLRRIPTNGIICATIHPWAPTVAMQFRRSGQRDERRRRVLNDSLLYPAATTRARRAGGCLSGRGGQGPVRRSENYGDAEFMDEQLRLTDLIPRKLPAFALLLLGGLLIIVGLEILYAWMPALAHMTTDGRVATLDLDGEGSIAVWFSSTMLGLAGLVAVLVFTVRRHRTDDYQGHYRVWLWAAMCWFLMSIDETASLHEGFKEMMSHVTGTRLFGDGSIWWVTAYFFLLGAVGTRLLVDMRHCRLSSAALLTTAGCYALAVIAQLNWILPEAGATGVMLEEGAEMTGNLMLLLAMGLHARYVILDAEGLLPQRKPTWPQEPAEEYEEESADEILLGGQRTVTVHPPHGVRRPSSTVLGASQLEEPVEDTIEQSEASVGRKLTKAERKALHRRLKKMQLQRRRAG